MNSASDHQSIRAWTGSPIRAGVGSILNRRRRPSAAASRKARVFALITPSGEISQRPNRGSFVQIMSIH